MQRFYKVPDSEQRKIALDSLAGLPFRLKKCLQQVLLVSKPMQKPKPGQWLWQHQQQGQSFLAYDKTMHNILDKKRNVIYIKPMEQMSEKFLQILLQYCECFFYPLKVKIATKGSLKNVSNRINQYSERRQYHAGEILKVLEKQLPSDGFCIIAICLQDLYPRDEWNFVFGLASIRQRTGVFSFARYDERFDDCKDKYQIDYDRILWSSISVMVHEITHMFGIRHCIFYDCVMNGSNHLEQSSKRQLQLCVVCLRKLQSNIKFDILERYKKLYEFVKKYGDNSKKNLKEYLKNIIEKIPLDKDV